VPAVLGWSGACAEGHGSPCFGIAEIAVLAGVTWVLTVLLADLMRRSGYRGPAEVLLRRLTYRPIPAPRAPPGG